MKLEDNTIWIFHGMGGKFASGAFKDLTKAKAWINKHKLTGVLTAYPIDIGVFDWATEHDLFEISKQHEKSPEFIQKFTSASMDHHHFEDGKKI
jgi:hypothetical protein